MENKPPPQLPPPNPRTSQKHAQETFWQIILPVLAGAILVMVFAVLVVGSTPAQASVGADASVIFLLIPMLLFGCIALAVSITLIVLVTRLLRALPPFTRLLQDNIEQVSVKIHQILDRSVEPILRLQSIAAVIQHLFRKP